MRKIYYITRSYLPVITGGTLIRKKQVDLLEKNGYKVIIVTLTTNKNEERITENEIKIYISKITLRILSKLENLGLIRDYLVIWSKRIIKILEKIICKEDILFITSGGELAGLEIGNFLKKKKGCTYIVNFHDPIVNTLVNNLKINSSKVLRDKYEKKYLENVDLVITSTKVLKNSLEKKYRNLSLKIKNSYFGYIEEKEIIELKENRIIKIGYGGNFSKVQSPEILIKYLKENLKVEIVYIGNYEKYNPILKYKDLKNIKLISSMEHLEFLEYFYKNIDIAFLPLIGDYFGACIPSKLYEYINLEKPILAVLPEGDAKNLILDLEIGEVIDLKDNLKEAQEKINLLISNKTKYIKNIRKIKSKFNMEYTFNEVIKELKNLTTYN